MAISTYSDLVSAVRDWLGRANDSTYLTESRVGDMIAFAEADIYARLRVRAMESSADITIDAQTESLPSDFIEARRLYLDTSPLDVLEYVGPVQFWQAFADTRTGRSTHFTIEGGSLVFGPYPDATYTGKLLYYARPAALSSATNAIFTANPDLFLYGTLAHAAPFTGAEDAPRMAVFAQMFNAALARVQTESDRDLASVPLTIRAG